jgi:hypothetical protein
MFYPLVVFLIRWPLKSEVLVGLISTKLFNSFAQNGFALLEHLNKILNLLFPTKSQAPSAETGLRLFPHIRAAGSKSRSQLKGLNES